jgi:hypothetical protein
MTRKSAWGRDVEESEVERDAFGRPRPRPRATPVVADFVEVGLCEADAKAASEGLAAGRYISFEDACLSAAIFQGSSKVVNLKEDVMRAKARAFGGGRPTMGEAWPRA